jgi:Lon protease-like protein
MPMTMVLVVVGAAFTASELKKLSAVGCWCEVNKRSQAMDGVVSVVC